jgi:hypothetical protein
VSKENKKDMKSQQKNKMSKEEEAKIKKMFIIHYERPEPVLC